ncbi:MAG: hypothetical protein P1V18_01405 [Candidatus Gracilibacteria bacterium]|nr:hypothetical protein [Candidatus Gracilibacteria bacterium]
MFDWLVHSKTRLRMLKMFFKDLERPLYGLEIAQHLKSSPGTTHRELTAMIKKDVLKKKKEGALVMYYVNTQHPFFSQLKQAIFPPKKKVMRVLFMSDLRLSVETPQEVINDFHLFCDYAEENATDIVFLGDMIEMINGCVFQTFLVHKPVFDRLAVLAGSVNITYAVGNSDCFLKLMCHENAGLLESKFKFTEEYLHNKLNIYATHGNKFDDLSLLKGFKPKKKVEYPGKNLLKAARKYADQDLIVEVAKYANECVDFMEYGKQKKFDYAKRLSDTAKEIIHEEDYSYVVMGNTHKASLKQHGHGIYFNCGSWKSEKKRKFIEIDREGGALVEMGELR